MTDVKRIVSLYRSGLSGAAVAKKMQCSKRTVRRVAIAARVWRFRQYRPPLIRESLRDKALGPIWHSCAVCSKIGERGAKPSDAWLKMEGWFIDRDERILCPDHAPQRDNAILSRSNLNWKTP